MFLDQPVLDNEGNVPCLVKDTTDAFDGFLELTPDRHRPNTSPFHNVYTNELQNAHVRAVNKHTNHVQTHVMV